MEVTVDSTQFTEEAVEHVVDIAYLLVRWSVDILINNNYPS